MTQKLIVVVGATGATGGQGGSVISSFLKDRNWKIRGTTRNPKGEAKALSAKGVGMVKADLDDLASVEKAFAGANVIFAITHYSDNFWTKGMGKVNGNRVCARHQHGHSDGKALVPHCILEESGGIATEYGLEGSWVLTIFIIE